MKTTAAITGIYARLNADLGMFARGSVNLLEAQDGFALVTLCRHQDVDLVVLEMLDNATTALALCKTLRSLERAPQLLVLAKTTNPAVLKSAREVAGAVLAEPVDAAQIITASAKLLGVPLREDVRILARLRVEASATHETHLIMGTIVDISTSGMLVETSSLASVGDILSAEFYLPGDKKQVALMAKVARVGQEADGLRDLGLQFMQGQEDATGRIKAFIDARQK